MITVPIRQSYEPLDDFDGSWQGADQGTVPDMSATAYFFAKKLYEVLGVPVGIINVSWGGTPIRSWMSPELLKKEFASEVSLKHFETGVLPDEYQSHCAGVLYNGMLRSVVPFTAKGFLWYQGCTDRNKPELYKRLQPAFAQMLPALFGGLGVAFVSKNLKISIAPILLMLVLFIFVPALNEGTVGIMVPVSALFTIAIGRILYKRGVL